MKLSNTKELLAYACYCGIDAKKYAKFFSMDNGKFDLIYLDSNDQKQCWSSCYNDFVHWIWHSCEASLKTDELSDLKEEKATFLQTDKDTPC